MFVAGGFSPVRNSCHLWARKNLLDNRRNLPSSDGKRNSKSDSLGWAVYTKEMRNSWLDPIWEAAMNGSRIKHSTVCQERPATHLPSLKFNQPIPGCERQPLVLSLGSGYTITGYQPTSNGGRSRI